MSYAHIPRRLLQGAMLLLSLLAVALMLSLTQASGASAATTSVSSPSVTQPGYPYDMLRAALASNEARTEHVQTAAPRTYIVHNGNTLSQIARRFYGTTKVWPCIYDANRAKVHNPNEIYVGQHLLVPVHLKTTGCHAPPAWVPHPVYHATATAAYHPTYHSYSGSFSGTLSCSGLEALWRAAGGSPAAAFMAAEIARAESSGYQYAHSPSDDIGFWQINVAAHGSMATYDPMGNAHAAIIISGNGSNWYPWTTYRTGAYVGQC